MATVEERRIRVGSTTEVPGLLLRPERPRALLVLAHGAGAGMRHRFMEAVAGALAGAGVATLRYEFPYMAEGRRRPDPPGVAAATVRAAVEAAERERAHLPIFAGGKSFGGRMTSLAAADGLLPAAVGLVFLGFPLHPSGRPSTTRAEHLPRVPQPMLFVQGTRDRLAEPELLRPVIERLGARAHLHELEGADHSFEVLRRAGRDPAAVLEEIAATVAGWMARPD